MAFCCATTNNIFFPLAWKDNKEIMVYSQEGYNEREWKLPQGGTNVQSWHRTFAMSLPTGLANLSTVKVKNGALILSMEPIQ